jgi:hypothetical protein
MKSRHRLALGLGVVLLTVFGSMSEAAAQYGPPRPYYAPPPPPRGVYRGGLLFGLGGGFGLLESDFCGQACGAAFAGEIHIGGMLNPRLAVMFDAWGTLRPWSDPSGLSHTTSNTFLTGALQYWVTDIVWLKGGLGLAYTRIITEGVSLSDDDTGLALWGAAGIEVLQSYNFALDIQFRFGNGFYDVVPDTQNYALLLGVNWY